MTWMNTQVPVRERRYAMFLFALYLLFPLGCMLGSFWLAYKLWGFEYAQFALPIGFAAAFLVRRMSARSMSRLIDNLEARERSARFGEDE